MKNQKFLAVALLLNLHLVSFTWVEDTEEGYTDVQIVATEMVAPDEEASAPQEEMVIVFDENQNDGEDFDNLKTAYDSLENDELGQEVFKGFIGAAIFYCNLFDSGVPRLVKEANGWWLPLMRLCSLELCSSDLEPIVNSFGFDFTERVAETQDEALHAPYFGRHLRMLLAAYETLWGEKEKDVVVKTIDFYVASIKSISVGSDEKACNEQQGESA